MYFTSLKWWPRVHVNPLNIFWIQIHILFRRWIYLNLTIFAYIFLYAFQLLLQTTKSWNCDCSGNTENQVHNRLKLTWYAYKRISVKGATICKPGQVCDNLKICWYCCSPRNIYLLSEVHQDDQMKNAKPVRMKSY